MFQAQMGSGKLQNICYLGGVLSVIYANKIDILKGGFHSRPIAKITLTVQSFGLHLHTLCVFYTLISWLINQLITASCYA